MSDRFTMADFDRVLRGRVPLVERRPPALVAHIRDHIVPHLGYSRYSTIAGRVMRRADGIISNWFRLGDDARAELRRALDDEGNDVRADGGHWVIDCHDLDRYPNVLRYRGTR